jgi:hypothetical protein
VDFTFSEAMDQDFATQLFNFDAGFPVFASSVEQISEGVLRATFTSPIVPGLDTITLGDELLDIHGNALVDPGAPVAVVAGTTVANGYEATPLLEAVENLGGDTVSLLFTQGPRSGHGRGVRALGRAVSDRQLARPTRTRRSAMTSSRSPS